MDSANVDNFSLMDENLSHEILQEIESQTDEKIRQQRAHDRVAVKYKFIMQPGNSSEFLEYKVQGVVGDISSGGCKAMLPIPVKVGDIYRLQFENGRVNLPLLFVRCIRCRLISEDAFETGFSFFNPISISQLNTSGDVHDLL